MGWHQNCLQQFFSNLRSTCLWVILQWCSLPLCSNQLLQSVSRTLFANGIIESLYNFVPSALSPLSSSESKSFPCDFLPRLLMHLGRYKNTWLEMARLLLRLKGWASISVRMGCSCSSSRAAVAGPVFPQYCLPKERVSGMLTLSHLGDCKSWIFQERFVWCVEISNDLFNVERHTLLKTHFFLGCLRLSEDMKLGLKLKSLNQILHNTKSKNTEQWSLCDVHTSNPEGNIRGSYIWSAWFLRVFLPFYCISLSRKYYLYEIILIWFQFIKWKECVRQSVLKRSGIWTIIESIPSANLCTLMRNKCSTICSKKIENVHFIKQDKKMFSEWSSAAKGKVWVPLSDWPYLRHLSSWRRMEGIVVEPYSRFCVSCLVYWFSVAVCWVCCLWNCSWEGLCPHVYLVTAVFSFILMCACCFLNQSQVRNHSNGAPGA